MSDGGPQIGQSVFAGTIAELTYPEYESAARRGALMLVPIAVVEEHGPHLPLGTDVYGAHVLCARARDRLAESGIEALIAPPVYWGVNGVTAAFPGTIRVRAEVFSALLHDVLSSMVDDGFAEIYVVNHHGNIEHNQIIQRVLAELHAEGSTGVRWPETEEQIEVIGAVSSEPTWVPFTDPPAIGELRFSDELGVHAHDRETALIDHYQPDLVDHDALAGLEPTGLGLDDLKKWRLGGEEALRMTPDGYFGDPHPHDPELWRFYELRGDAIATAITAQRASKVS